MFFVKRLDWQLGSAHQVLIDVMSSLSSFSNCPDYKRLAAPGIAGRKDAGCRAHITVIGSDTSTAIELDGQLLQQTIANRTGETDRYQHKIGFEIELAIRDALQRRP